MVNINKTNKKYCRHCLPQKRRNHFITRVSYHLDNFKYHINRKSKSKSSSVMWPLFLDFLYKIKISKYDYDPDKTKLYNRSLIFFEEAKRRNIKIYAVKILGFYTNDFGFFYNSKKYSYEGVPINSVGKQNNLIDDKHYLKNFIKAKYPVSKGGKLSSVAAAKELANKIGFPVVIKPAYGSLSQHATYPITSQAELIRAINISKKYSRGFLLEKYVEGNLYRVTVIGKELLYVAQKERPNVVGDGKSTIRELVVEKNKSRKSSNVMNSTLHKIIMNQELENYLKYQDLKLNDIIKKNHKVYLSNKFVLAHGCDVIGCSSKINKNTKNMFIKLAKKLDTDFVGFDFICSDISKDYKNQNSAIIEANSMPYVDMHQNPSHGEKDNVAKDLWDMVLERTNLD